MQGLAMLGLMSERPLLISAIITHAATITATPRSSRAPSKARSTATPMPMPSGGRNGSRAHCCGSASNPATGSGTLAWNTFRHFELYYAISGIGAVCHTINPRLFDDQIVYIVNHAADRLLFVETSFIPLVERLAPHFPADCRIVLLTEQGAEPHTGFPRLPCYES